MSAPFKGAVLNCKVCGSAFKVPPSRASTAETCSIKCASVVKSLRREKRVTIVCVNCGRGFESPACQAHRRTYCSHECKHESSRYRMALSARMSGRNNPMWIGGFVDHTDGYVYAYAPDHPFASNGYVLAHRMVMERWLRLSDPESGFLVKLGCGLYLSPEYVIHHRDENKRNNVIDNLECLTASEHTRLHSLARAQAAASVPP